MGMEPAYPAIPITTRVTTAGFDRSRCARQGSGGIFRLHFRYRSWDHSTQRGALNQLSYLFVTRYGLARFTDTVLARFQRAWFNVIRKEVGSRGRSNRRDGPAICLSAGVALGQTSAA